MTKIESPTEVMTIKEAAAYLQISTDTLYKYASEGFLPAFKMGNRWRFRRSALNEWMQGLERQKTSKVIVENWMQEMKDRELVRCTSAGRNGN